MNLKKIDLNLQKALQESEYVEANKLQTETFSPIKSGADVAISGTKNSGKTTALVFNVIHKLKQPKGESPRALIIVATKEEALQMLELFTTFNKYNKLRIFGTHDKTDIDEDKNEISAGIDVLIGTPNRLNQMFSGAGFNVSELLVVAFDNFDLLLKNRNEIIILRLLTSMTKGQRLYFYTKRNEKVETVVCANDREPIFITIN